jgi:hypothetical protein
MESVAESKRQRLARAFIEVRGYGFTDSERAEAERLAAYFYLQTESAEVASAS